MTKKARAKNKKPKVTVFVANADVFKLDVSVCVGGGIEDIRAYAKKHKFRKEIIEFLQKEDAVEALAIKDSLGIAFWNSDIKFAAIVLQPYYDAWQYWECLMHELHHIVFYLSNDRNFKEEVEAQAYTQEALFRQIRRKLQGVQKI